MEDVCIELLKIIKDLEMKLYEKQKDMDDLITYLAEHNIYISVETRKLSSRLDKEEEQC